MLRRPFISPFARRHAATAHAARIHASASGKRFDPLRILFCGSDQFSCASLKALNDEHHRNRELIKSIDVLVRPGKRYGKGHRPKTILEGRL
jgi:methionyl-tRNA formyltransferase